MKVALKLLMESDMKTYELAEAVGYHDVRSFTEKFREYFGESPSSYKKTEVLKNVVFYIICCGIFKHDAQICCNCTKDMLLFLQYKVY